MSKAKHHFFDKISTALKQDLPGFKAQSKMAPLGRRPPLEYLQEGVTPLESAVLILIYEDLEGHLNTILIQRPSNERGVHAGQISFSGGGRHSSDFKLEDTALREAWEEVGVDPNKVMILGGLTPLYIPVSNYIVHPFVGALHTKPDFMPAPEEVEEILEWRIMELFREDRKSEVEKFLKVKGQASNVPCYKMNGKIVWGATAMILSELEDVMNRILI